MTDYDVIFSIFDIKTGPIILYDSSESIDTAKKIAMKSYIAIGAMEETPVFESKYAILPLPSYQKIAFCYMFRIQSNEVGKHLYATIANTSDSESTIKFYRTLSSLQTKVSSVAEFIQNNFKYEGKETELNEAVSASLNSLKSVSLLEEKTEEIPTTSELSYEDFKQGDLPFLLDYFQQDLDKVIYALLLEEPILIVGNVKDLVEKVVSSFSFLVPHRILFREYLMTYTDPQGKDLLICSPHVDFLKKYKKITNIHLESRKITSKYKNFPSISNLIHTLAIAPKSTQEEVIKKYIDKLLGATSTLMELCERDQMSKEEIHEFRADLNADELNIVISMVRNYAPQFESKLFHFARSLI